MLPRFSKSRSEGSPLLDLENLTVGNSVPIQVETVPKGVLDKVKLFYCCIQCGKVFWEGSHFQRVCEQFSHVLGKVVGQSESALSAHTIYDELKGVQLSKDYKKEDFLKL